MKWKLGKYILPVVFAGTFFLNSCGSEEKDKIPMVEDVYTYEMKVMMHETGKVSGEGLLSTIKEKYPNTDLYETLEKVVDFNVKYNGSKRVRNTIGRDIMSIKNGKFEVEPDGIRGDIIYAREDYLFPKSIYPVLEMTELEFLTEIHERLQAATKLDYDEIDGFKVIRKGKKPVYTREVN